MKKVVLTCLSVCALSFAEKPIFQDRRGLQSWQDHESRVNMAIEAGAVGEVRGEMPDPNVIRDSTGTGRIQRYAKLFSKKEDGVYFNAKYDFLGTLEKGNFHQGHLWEALWQIEGNGTGRFFLPGFEKGGEGCELLLHFRFDRWTKSGFEHGKEQRCVSENRIYKLENKVIRVWKAQVKALGDVIWKEYPDQLTSGAPQLIVEITNQGKVKRCEVIDGDAQITMKELPKLCKENLNSEGKGFDLEFSIPL